VDWTKSKSILILALVLTNFILIYSVIDSRKAFDEQVERESEAWVQVLDLAKEKQIKISEEPVYYLKTLTGVRLEYQMYDPEQIAKNLMGSYTVKLGKYTSNSGEEMTLENGNKLLYAKNIPKAVPAKKALDSNSAKMRAERFLNDIQFSSADMQFWNVQQQDQITTVIFRQYYKKLFLDDAYMAVTFQGDQIVKFERKWFNPPEDLKYTRKIISPSKALFMSIDMLLTSGEKAPIEIKSLELGYRLDSSSLVSSVKAGEASPYWRILTQTGKVYYIEAQY
jgi:regulatory protein YycI of two-component signal transduction system YycFG